jgi:hypothetical protein
LPRHKTVGNVDERVQTLREAADTFGDPSLRFTAAEALAGADRPGEAEQELDVLLATAPPDWPARRMRCGWPPSSPTTTGATTGPPTC